jgi:hypothetical protein
VAVTMFAQVPPAESEMLIVGALPDACGAKLKMSSSELPAVTPDSAIWKLDVLAVETDALALWTTGAAMGSGIQGYHQGSSRE